MKISQSFDRTKRALNRVHNHARLGAAGLALALASAPAMAGGGGGWITAITNLTALGRAGATAVTALAFMLGLVAIAYGGKLLWDKGGDRGDDIKMGRIVFTIVGGVVLLALGFFALQTVLTLGGTAGDIGQGITVR